MAKCPKPWKNKGKVAQPSYMKPAKFRYLLDRLGLQGPGYLDAARFLHIHPRSVIRLAHGESPIDARTAMLLHILVKHGISAEKATQHLEM